jgi:hypothetical protein
MNINDKIATVATLCAVGFLAVFIISMVGQMDYDDAKRVQQHYCEMVKSGLWPGQPGNAGCTEQNNERAR